MSVYFTARAGISCIKKEEPIRNSLNIQWTLFQSMDIDMVKERFAKKIHFRIFKNRLELLNTIEMKKFVDDGIL